MDELTFYIMYRHKLIKELPNHKIGEIVQFFGFYEEEPYKSILKENQIIPEIGWYWKDDIERKGCVTNYNEYCKCEYNVDTLPDWFTPLILSKNGVDIYANNKFSIIILKDYANRKKGQILKKKEIFNKNHSCKYINNITKEYIEKGFWSIFIKQK